MTDLPLLERHEWYLADASKRLLSPWLLDLLERWGFHIQRDYTIQIANATSNTTFDEVDVFYKRVGLPGVVFLTEKQVAPGQARYFDLGACSEMESYVVGFFIGDDLVAQLPAEGDGNMTPARASQLKPADVDACADAWAITD